MKTDNMTIKVEKVGKYGVLVDGQWVGISSYGGVKLSDFKESETYDVVIQYSNAGKAYIKEVVTDKPEVKVAPKPVKEEVKAVRQEVVSAPVVSRDTSIVRQAVIKSVLESPAFAAHALTVSPDKIIDIALTWAEKCEQWVNRG